MAIVNLAAPVTNVDDVAQYKLGDFYYHSGFTGTVGDVKLVYAKIDADAVAGDPGIYDKQTSTVTVTDGVADTYYQTMKLVVCIATIEADQYGWFIYSGDTGTEFPVKKDGTAFSVGDIVVFESRSAGSKRRIFPIGIASRLLNTRTEQGIVVTNSASNLSAGAGKVRIVLYEL